MNSIRLSRSWLAAIAIGIFLITGMEALAAVDFNSDCPDTPVTDPVPCDDNTPSLGRFHIWVNPIYSPLMVGYPSYNPTTNILTSPNLFDPNTIIGRSAAHLEGSVGPNSDIGGTPVGDLGTLISDANFTFVPPGFETTGGREIHTEIVDLQMTAFPPVGGMVLRAGAAPYGLTLSPGEIESKSNSGLPANDFPAQSFFDVYVEVDLPAAGLFPGATVFNPPPFPTVVEADPVNDLPPSVVYIHGFTRAVPVVIRPPDNPPLVAGTVFGMLIIAGHGANIPVVGDPPDEEPDPDYLDFFVGLVDALPPMEIWGACCVKGVSCVDDWAPEDCAESIDVYYPGQTCAEVGPCRPTIPAVTEWGLAVMVLLGLIAGTIMFRKARAAATV